jgi:DNA-binding NarL/FixJ family response regulator
VVSLPACYCCWHWRSRSFLWRLHHAPQAGAPDIASIDALSVVEPDMQVVGEASTGREALILAQTLAPDVVLMDLEMPGMDGIEATAALRTIVPHSAVVILGIHIDRQTRIRAQAAGAVAFVEKRGTTDTLLAAIRQAAGQTGVSIEEREVPNAKQGI